MTTSSNSAEEIAQKIRSLKNQLTGLQEDVRFTSLRDRIEDLQTTVNNLDQEITNLRARGYVFNKGLETQAKDFAQQWRTLQPGVTRQIEEQAKLLGTSLRPIENQITQLAARVQNPSTASPLLNRVEAAIGTLEGNISAAEKSIQGMFDQLKAQVNELVARLARADWMLTEISEATFQLLSAEAGIVAVKAVWVKGGKERKDDPEGVLFLTDQRLIFEQKEKVATKKVLFITTEKKLVQQLLWQCPVALVEEIKTEKQGMLKNEDHLDINLASGAPYPSVHVHIWGDCETWRTLIKRAKSKDFDKDRAIPISAADVEKVKSAPESCSACGATVDQVVLRGMDSITCNYCGHVMRL